MPSVLLALRLALFALLLAPSACRTLAGDPWSHVVARPWRLVAIEGEPVSAGSPARLTLEGESQIVGNGGVNRFFGTYERVGRTGFRCGRLALTRQAGPPELMREEARLVELLAYADGIRVDGDELVLLLAGEPVLLFVLDH